MSLKDFKAPRQSPLNALISGFDAGFTEQETVLQFEFSSPLVTETTITPSNFLVVVNEDVKPIIGFGVDPTGKLELIFVGIEPVFDGSMEILSSDVGLQIVDDGLVDPQGPYYFSHS